MGVHMVHATRIPALAAGFNDSIVQYPFPVRRGRHLLNLGCHDFAPIARHIALGKAIEAVANGQDAAGRSRIGCVSRNDGAARMLDVWPP